MAYASGTKVNRSKTVAEIERVLERYGADQFAYGWKAEDASLGFRMERRMYRFKMPMPDLSEFDQTPTGQTRSESAARTQHAQAVRARWRALLLIIKAKLEAIETGITTLEHEFLAQTVMPDGKTVGEVIGEQIALAYQTGAQPPLLEHRKES